MKDKVNILTAILFLAGLSVLLYPFLSNSWNTHRQNELIVSYEGGISANSDEELIEQELERAAAYNEVLSPIMLPDSFAVEDVMEQDVEYMSLLNLNGDGIMGIVEIPKINIQLPIYHTTAPEVLNNGAGHLYGSSLPIGGKNTHSVISAHRGFPSSALFTDLNLLKPGDHFLLRILGNVLCYEVDRIIVVEPDDTENLNVVQGEDLVTLLTCTPYAVNSHRLLVRGHRVPYEQEVVIQEEDTAPISIVTTYWIWIAGGISLSALLALVLGLRERAYLKRLQVESEEH